MLFTSDSMVSEVCHTVSSSPLKIDGSWITSVPKHPSMRSSTLCLRKKHPSSYTRSLYKSARIGAHCSQPSLAVISVSSGASVALFHVFDEKVARAGKDLQARPCV